MSKFRLLCCLVLAAALLAGCATTEITNSWRSDSYSGHLDKVLVLGVAEKGTTRKAFETAFANHLENWGVDAVPGFTVLPETDASEEEIAAAAKRVGAGTILITKLVDLQQETQRVTDIDTDRAFGPSGYPYYHGRYPYRYYPYYDHWYNDYSSSFTRVRTYDVEYKTLEMETSLYALPGGEVVWTALSRTTTAEPLQTKVADIVQKIVDQLVADGLI